MMKVVVRVTGLNRIPCWVKSMMAQKVCLCCQRQVINLKCMVKEKKEPPGYCEACNKRLSRKSDVSRHWRLSCPKNTKRKQCRTKGETDLPGK